MVSLNVAPVSLLGTTALSGLLTCTKSKSKPNVLELFMFLLVIAILLLVIEELKKLFRGFNPFVIGVNPPTEFALKLRLSPVYS